MAPPLCEYSLMPAILCVNSRYLARWMGEARHFHTLTLKSRACLPSMRSLDSADCTKEPLKFNVQKVNSKQLFLIVIQVKHKTEDEHHHEITWRVWNTAVQHEEVDININLPNHT